MIRVVLASVVLSCAGLCGCGSSAADDDGAEGSMASERWLTGSGSSPDVSCAEISVLAPSNLDEIVAGPGRELALRVRVRADPVASVPVWLWQVDREQAPPEPGVERSAPRAAAANDVDVAALDEGATTATFPIERAGSYRVIVHSHYPGTATCGVDVSFELN